MKLQEVKKKVAYKKMKEAKRKKEKLLANEIEKLTESART